MAEWLPASCLVQRTENQGLAIGTWGGAVLLQVRERPPRCRALILDVRASHHLHKEEREQLRGMRTQWGLSYFLALVFITGGVVGKPATELPACSHPP